MYLLKTTDSTKETDIMIGTTISRETLFQKVKFLSLDEKVLKFYCCDIDLIFCYGANYGNNFVARFENIDCSAGVKITPADPIWDKYGYVLTEY